MLPGVARGSLQGMRAKATDFVKFSLAVLFKAEEDQDTIWNKAVRWGARISLGLATGSIPFVRIASLLVPVGGGRLVALDSLVQSWIAPGSCGLFILLAFYGAFEKYLAEQKLREAAQSTLKALKTPKLRIVYRAGQPGYFQRRRLNDKKEAYDNIAFRVGIANDSAVTVRNARLVLKTVDQPTWPVGFVVSAPFRVAHQEPQLGFIDVPPGPPVVFFDIAFHDVGILGVGLNTLSMAYVSGRVGPSLSSELPVCYRFTVLLSGEDTQPCEAHFRLSQDSTGTQDEDPFKYVAELVRIDSGGHVYQEI